MNSLLSRIRESGIQLRLDEQDQLKVIVQKGSRSNELIDEIRAHKAEIINYLLRNKSTSGLYTIKKSPVQDHYRISSSQLRIWILSQFEEASLAFNISECIPLEEGLNIEAFKQAICKTIDRHEILRTVFKEDQYGEIRQWVIAGNCFDFQIPVIEVQAGDQIIKTIREYIESDSRKPFDLAEGPLIRNCIFKNNSGPHYFYCSMHHMICDGWSINVLKKDIKIIYENILHNQVETLQELPVQYKDYAEWQLKWLESDEMKRQQEFWMKQFEEVPPVLNLPVTKIRPAIKNYHGLQCSYYLNPVLTAKLKEICQQQGCTLYMGLLTSLIILFYKYTGQNDITIGSPVSGRAVAELEDQIGCYLNMVALRTRFNDDDDFKSLLAKVRAVVTNAFRNDNYPFEKILEDLTLGRDLSRSPLFDIMMVLQNTGDTWAEVSAGLQDDRIEDIGVSYSKYDLTFEFQEYVQGIRSFIQFNTDVYDKPFIHQLIHQLKRAIEINTTHPGTALKDLEVLSSEEKNALIKAYNNTAAVYDSHATVLDLFYKVVKEYPDSTAVCFKEWKLTFKQLDECSNRFAYYIIDRGGVKQGSRVVVNLPRSQWLIVVLLGVLKSGGIYLPLDSVLPKERIDYISSDSEYTMLIDEPCLNEFNNTLDRWPNERLAIAVRGGQSAYIIYTSGSTGRPKGVEIRHRSLVNFLLSMQKAPGIKHTDMLLSVTTPSFDISLLEFLLPLISGACLFVCDPSVIQDPELMLQVMEEIQPTVMQATPGFWRLLFDAGWKGNKRLKVLCGGEELDHPLGEKLLSRSGELWNMYGPTETTIWSTINHIKHDNDIKSIGRPINNTQVFIVDKNGHLLPAGATGEIYIGGDGLSVGYVNKPALTAERFIAPSFDSSITLYKTGDLGKWLSNGTLQYQGRADSQVKIRGYRIELGEIDHAILRLEMVKQVVTVVDATVPDRKELISYFVASEKCDPREIRNQLKQFLPAYMLPSHLIQLDALPVTPNGKIDRKNLPAPQEIGSSEDQDIVDVLTEKETVLINIYKQVLKKNTVHLKDNFFELGGDSVKAVRLMNQLKRHGFNCRMADLMKYPVVEELGKLIMSLSENSGKQPINESNETKELGTGLEISDRSFPLSHNQLLYIKNGTIAHAYESFGFLLQGFERDRFKKAYFKLLEQYGLLRIRLIKENLEFYQQIQPVHEAPIAIEFIPSSTQEIGEHLNEYITQQKNKPFDLFNGETIRMAVFFERDRAYVYITVHHIITNKRSNQQLRDFFCDSYYNKEVQPVTYSYFDYIAVQNRFLNSQEGVQQMAFWHNKFYDLMVPVDNDKSLVNRSAICYIKNYQMIDGELFNRVKTHCIQNKILVNCWILSVFTKFLADRNKDTGGFFLEVTVDGSSLNLPGIDHHEVVGQYVNILPLYIPRVESAEPTKWVSTIQENYLEALLYQQIPVSMINVGFKERHKVAFHEVNDLAFNFVDLSNEEDNVLKAKGQDWNGLSSHTINRNNPDEIVLRAFLYNQELQLEWELPCLQSDAEKVLTEKYFINQIKQLIHNNV